MTHDKFIGKIPCELISKEQAADLKLQGQVYLMVIPKSVLQRHGIAAEKFTFHAYEDEDNEIYFSGTPTLEN